MSQKQPFEVGNLDKYTRGIEPLTGTQNEPPNPDETFPSVVTNDIPSEISQTNDVDDNKEDLSILMTKKFGKTKDLRSLTKDDVFDLKIEGPKIEDSNFELSGDPSVEFPANSSEEINFNETSQTGGINSNEFFNNLEKREMTFGANITSEGASKSDAHFFDGLGEFAKTGIVEKESSRFSGEALTSSSIDFPSVVEDPAPNNEEKIDTSLWVEEGTTLTHFQKDVLGSAEPPRGEEEEEIVEEDDDDDEFEVDDIGVRFSQGGDEMLSTSEEDISYSQAKQKLKHKYEIYEKMEKYLSDSIPMIEDLNFKKKRQLKILEFKEAEIERKKKDLVDRENDLEKKETDWENRIAYFLEEKSTWQKMLDEFGKRKTKVDERDKELEHLSKELEKIKHVSNIQADKLLVKQREDRVTVMEKELQEQIETVNSSLYDREMRIKMQEIELEERIKKAKHPLEDHYELKTPFEDTLLDFWDQKENFESMYKEQKLRADKLQSENESLKNLLGEKKKWIQELETRKDLEEVKTDGFWSFLQFWK